MIRVGGGCWDGRRAWTVHIRCTIIRTSRPMSSPQGLSAPSLSLEATRDLDLSAKQLIIIAYKTSIGL